MYIEEVIIDGFKSYSTRVTVGPFDRQFNAITGQEPYQSFIFFRDATAAPKP